MSENEKNDGVTENKEVKKETGNVEINNDASSNEVIENKLVKFELSKEKLNTSIFWAKIAIIIVGAFFMDDLPPSLQYIVGGAIIYIVFCFLDKDRRAKNKIESLEFAKNLAQEIAKEMKKDK